MNRYPTQRPWACYVGFAVVGGFVLRTAFLTSKSFWMDEGFTVFMARTDWHSFFHQISTNEMNMALYYALMRAWAHFGIGEFWLRFFSVLASTATLPIVYFVGKELADRRTGLIAAFLLAVQPGHIAYAQEARSYSLEILLFTLAVWSVLRFVRSGSAAAWSGYIGSSLASMYCHVLVLLAWPATGVPIAANRKSLRLNATVRLLTAVGFLLCLPVLRFAVSRGRTLAAAASGRTIATWIPPLSWHSALDALQLITLPKFEVVYVLAWIAAVASGLRGSKRKLEPWVLGFLLCWLLLPPALLAGLSLYKAVFLSRMLLVCVPAACLLAALGTRALPRVPQYVACAVFLALSLKAVASQYRRSDAKEDWRGAAAYVCSQATPDELVQIIPEYGRFTFDYYRELNGPKQCPIDGAESLSVSPHAARKWLVVFGAVGSNAIATSALASATNGSGATYCPVRARQFNLIEVWLLEPCSTSVGPR